MASPIGEPSYNEGLIGGTSPRSNSYNRGLVGSAPNYADSYNRGLAGNMPAYPSSYNTKNVGTIPNYPSQYNKGTVGDSSPNYPDSYGFELRGSGEVNSGTRPIALHTEYASGEAEWDSAYRGDVIFYMVRADEGSAKDNEPESQAKGTVSGDAGGVSSDTIPANAQAGPNPTSVQTAPQQVAAKATSGMSSAGPAGPQTGIDRSSVASEPVSGAGRSAAAQAPIQTRSLEAPIGLATQATARYSTQFNTAVNVSQATKSLSGNDIIRNYPGSEVFFSDLLHSSFNPGVTRQATRSPQEIELSLSSPKTADLSIGLAYASGGIRSSVNLIQGINRGDIGLVTPKTVAQAGRSGPQISNTRYSR